MRGAHDSVVHPTLWASCASSSTSRSLRAAQSRWPSSSGTGGNWYVIFQVELSDPHVERGGGPAVGIDMGLARRHAFSRIWGRAKGQRIGCLTALGFDGFQDG